MNEQIARELREANEIMLSELGQRFYSQRGSARDEIVGKRDSQKRQIVLSASSTIREGDILTSPGSDEQLRIIHVEKKIVATVATKTIAEYETPRQRDQRLAEEHRRTAPSFAFGAGSTFQGSIIGSQEHAHLTASFDQRAIEAEIERRGGDDVDALKAMVAEIREMLDDSNKISRGSLVQYSELLERHSWIAGALAQTVIGWLVASFKP